MKSSTLQVVLWVSLIFCASVYTKSQIKDARKSVGNISGKVTIKGKAAPGITVVLRLPSRGQQTAVALKDTTDQDGKYRITNVPPGTYQVMPAAPALVLSVDPFGKSLIMSEGETVEGIDFELTRGGVITGRVTDSEDRPLIEEPINLLPVDQNQNAPPFMPSRVLVQTDDRGIYRIFGIPQGRYRVAVGQSEEGSFAGGMRRSRYKQTFHPAVTDPAKASVIEVTEGSEATNVDISVARSLATFAVSGRIVNGETQQSLPNVRLALVKIEGDGRSTSMTSESMAGSTGEFKIENVIPGKYVLFISPRVKSDLYAEAVPFDVIDQDVSGLQLKTSRGASVSGLIVLEGTNDRSALRQLVLQTHVASEGFSGFGHSTPINPDGSFWVGGLQSGVAHFSIGSTERRPFQGMITRFERDGIVQDRPLELKDGEQVSGVRLVVNYGNGSVRGIIKVEGGEIPATARFSVWLTNPSDDPTQPSRSFVPSSQVDSRGRFLVEGLAAGAYEVHAAVYIPGSRGRAIPASQQVNVANGSVTEVTLTVRLDPNPGAGNP
ncbi:MAG TPA: carboxypeptidase regulatory-like domain-containing protein [Pyrinomonadaceae bacterium]|nr:carboxypeptidase regulatory-like domain-containing protein [Pyrinomonadaceae bacterium]